MGRRQTFSLPNVMKQLKQAYKYLEDGVRAKGGWVGFAKYHILLIGTLTMILGCGKDEIPPAPQEFKVVWDGEPSNSWNVATFTIEPEEGWGPVYRVKVIPTVVPTTYNWLALQLSIKYDGAITESNVVLGAPANLTNRAISIDIGGNISASSKQCSIWVTAFLPGDYRAATPRKALSFTPRTSSRTLSVEQDEQASFGVFDSAGSASFFANIAFGAAGKNLSFYPNQTTLTDENMPCIGENCVVSFSDFVSQYKNQGKDMYLAGVKNLVGNVIGAGRSGLSINRPDRQAGSLLFMEHIYGTAASYGLPQANLLYWDLTHELGHQNVLIVHPQDSNGVAKRNHDSPFCVMNDEYLFIGDNDNDSTNDPPGIERYFYYNPFFCNADVSKLTSAVP